MVANIVIVAAVPFCAARLTPSCGRSVFRKASEISKFDKTDDILSEPSTKRRRTLSVKERLHIRRLKNKESAQLSRDRAKLQGEYLEKQLHELRCEKMKLLLKNEYLQKQNQELEEENLNLKGRFQNLQCPETEEDSNLEVAVNHAWFVNIPLLKGWALPNIFIILMISAMESLKTHSTISQLCFPYLYNQSALTLPKIVIHLLCQPWKLLIHHLTSPQLSMIFNG